MQLNYPGQPALFNGLSCTLATGELVALVGPSGSGKTSLLNLLAGLLTPTAGQVVFNGHTVTHQDARQRHVGMVFQDFALYPHLTVLDNVAFPLNKDKVGILNLYNVFKGRFSGKNRQLLDSQANTIQSLTFTTNNIQKGQKITNFSHTLGDLVQNLD
ncbi:ATP-binding cassette domain-containing protein [Lactiplantibacillus garii]|uniref:ATP-binding cassette domain-containing protein n=1 Tax=Lactiplantibacillus garii TaxID=2306423 RepID=UPI00384C14AC